MDTLLTKKAKTDFKRYLFNLMNNSVFRKTMENIRIHRNIKLVTTGEKKKRNNLVQHLLGKRNKRI